MRATTVDGSRYAGGTTIAIAAPPTVAAESAIKRAGFEMIAGMLVTRVFDGRILPDQCRKLLVLAAQSARAGLSLETATAAVNRAVERCAGDAGSLRGWNVEWLRRDLAAAASTAVVQAHNEDIADQMPVRSLVSRLAASRAAQQAQRATPYAVLAVALSPRRDDICEESRACGQERVALLHRELDRRCARGTTATLTEHGGTIIVPVDHDPAPEFDGLIAALSTVAEAPVTATLIMAAEPDIPNAADRTHELLDVIQRLGYAPGVHRFTDLAVEYQLTRPGPGLERLKTVLEPLEDHPRLLRTLAVHIESNLSRQHTAAVMRVHRNTIDYRLRRIQELTGYDASRPPGIWYLQAGLIIRSFGQTRPDAG
ncbi:MAG: helix-turn-helix domain-containing protein [Nocardia sp.]|nr:helix-turn-helix domain-containing protein [Nocardia sp.]